MTSPDSWTEFSLTTSPELAESVADALHDVVEGGVVLEQLNDQSGSADRWEYDVATGPVIVRGYLANDENMQQRMDQVEFAIRCLNMVQHEQGLPLIAAPTYKETRREDWGESWKQNYKPLRIAERVLIVPSWIDTAEAAPRPDDVVLRLDPGQAFGTGLHPTTQLCAQALEQIVPAMVARDPAARMLDVGHGTAILGIIAAKLGITHVLGVDIEHEAVDAGRENAEINGVADRVFSEFGSWDAACVQPPYALVVANILAPVIVRLLGQGMGRVGRNFVFSGILDTASYKQSQVVMDALPAAGLRFVSMAVMNDWVCIQASE